MTINIGIERLNLASELIEDVCKNFCLVDSIIYNKAVIIFDEIADVIGVLQRIEQK